MHHEGGLRGLMHGGGRRRMASKRTADAREGKRTAKGNGGLIHQNEMIIASCMNGRDNESDGVHARALVITKFAVVLPLPDGS
jgi:hypothetical protein